MSSSHSSRGLIGALLSLALLLLVGGGVTWKLLNADPNPPPVPEALTPPSPPTTVQINRVLDGALALVEAQHTYYTHVKRGEKFAESVKELGFRRDQGAVQISEVWNASTDAVPVIVPIEGYVYTCKLMTRNAGEKDGFVIAAFPQDEKLEWPYFLSIVPNAEGSVIGMSSRDTWEIKDSAAAAQIRPLFKQERVVQATLNQWSPASFPATTTIKNFKKPE